MAVTGHAGSGPAKQAGPGHSQENTPSRDRANNVQIPSTYCTFQFQMLVLPASAAAPLASDSASAWLHSLKFKFTGNPYLNPDENVAKCSLATSELDSDHSSHLEPCPSI
jgi:hypothetical protein